MSADVRARFLARLPEPARAVFAGVADLAARLDAIVAEVAAAHPDVPLDAGALAEALAARLDGGAEPADLTALRAADVHLAAACAAGDPAALREFDRLFGDDLDLAVARSPGLGLTRDEFRQIVREKLFVAEPGQPARIASYGGRGALRAWVRVTAARLVVDLARRHDGAEPCADDDLARRMQAAGDPELDYLRHAWGRHLPDAFAEALARLSIRQRNLLRQRWLHDIAADRLAKMYGVHRATMFGWLEDARRALLERLGEALRARLPGHELDSVIALLGSRLDVSVRRLLDSKLEDEAKGG